MKSPPSCCSCHGGSCVLLCKLRALYSAAEIGKWEESLCWGCEMIRTPHCLTEHLSKKGSMVTQPSAVNNDANPSQTWPLCNARVKVGRGKEYQNLFKKVDEGIHSNARIQAKHMVGTVVGVVGLRLDATQTLYGICAAHTAQAATCGFAFAGPAQLIQRQPV